MYGFPIMVRFYILNVRTCKSPFGAKKHRQHKVKHHTAFPMVQLQARN
uniref:Uncharacterized protein n=1 Tax=Arundo donax TaxID=35708 RepID=A0A0A9ELT7_ARUDO